MIGDIIATTFIILGLIKLFSKNFTYSTDIVGKYRQIHVLMYGLDLGAMIHIGYNFFTHRLHDQSVPVWIFATHMGLILVQSLMLWFLYNNKKYFVKYKMIQVVDIDGIGEIQILQKHLFGTNIYQRFGIDQNKEANEFYDRLVTKAKITVLRDDNPL